MAVPAVSDPWFKFYSTDWRSDPGLRLCSRAARGTWIDMLSIMHEAEPYGDLRVNGLALDAPALAKLLGEAVSDIESDLEELERNGVFSRRKNGCIFSRRMEKDENLRRKNRANGKLGGNPTIRKQTENDKPVNPPDNAEDKAQKPDTREVEDANASLSEASSDPPKKSRSRNSYPREFEEFWSAYPTDKLMSKKAAFAAWKRLDEESRSAAIASVPSFNAYCRQHKDYRPVHAVRYLTEERYIGFLEQAKEAANRVFVEKGSPAWQAWQQHGRTPSARSESGAEGWWFPAEWPSEVRAGNA